MHTFGVQKEAKEKRRKYSPVEVVGRIKGVRNFLSRCELEVRELAGIEGHRILQGPDGVNSAQTVRDITQLLGQRKGLFPLFKRFRLLLWKR